MSRNRLSIVIPVFEEEESLTPLVDRLDALSWELRETLDLEVIFVDDHSGDGSPALLKRSCAERDRWCYLRLATNSGSHVAILAGLEHSRGDCAVFLAADLQDPPELVPKLLESWRAGHRVVWAVREEHRGISWLDRLTARGFYALLNRFSPTKLPPSGSDFALLDRSVVEALSRSARPNPSIGVEIARLGFETASIPYVKASREHGVSKWGLEARLEQFADAFITASYVPLRMMSYLGLAASALGFLYALLVILVRFVGDDPVPGWAALMVVVLVFGGLQMIMLGVLGEYLWRTLEQARRRPLYFVEESEGFEPENGARD